MRLEIIESCKLVNESNNLLMFKIDGEEHILTPNEEIQLYVENLFEIKDHLICCVSFMSTSKNKKTIPTLWIKEKSE